MKQWSIGPGPAGTLIVVGDPENPIPVLIQNVDPANTAYLGETAAVNPTNPLENVPLLPGQSAIATGDINVYAIAAQSQNVAINTSRGFGNFFQPTNLTNLGGVAIYNTATAPTQPPTIPVNSLWFTPTGGIEQWNGTSWVALSFSGQSIITANTITAAQLAAGIIYAGIVNGTTIVAGTFKGTDFEINANGAFFYNGTPALGNLKVAIASVAGTDRFGNVYTDHVAAYNTAIAGSGYAQIACNSSTGLPYLVLQPPGITNRSANPQVIGESASAGGAAELTQIVLYSGAEAAWGGAGAAYVTATARSQDGTVPSSVSLNGDQTHCTPKDGLTYSLGRYCTRTTSTITINQTTAQQILVANVAAQAYRVRIHIIYLGGGTAASANIGFNTGTATASNTIGKIKRGRTSLGSDAITIVNTSGLPGGSIVAFNANELCDFEFEGIITFSAAGTLQVYGTTSVAADTYAIATNSYAELKNIL